MPAAGGLFYHLRAMHAGRAWEPFREALGTWLAQWRPTDHLAIVGPSAGYCLEDAFLRRFARITAFEPEPVARFLFRRRVTRLGVSVAFVHEDQLVLPLWRGEPGLDRMLRAAPGASVLFANLLGQLPFLIADERRSTWQAAWTSRILPALASRPWASFHDRLSTRVTPRASGRVDALARLSDTEIAARLFPHVRGRFEIRDHGTEGLFPASLPHSYFHWELERGAHHVIEAVRES